MNKRSHHINHPSELNSLITPWPFRKAGRGAIHLSPECKHPEREQWEASINRDYYACGCSTSAQWLLITLALGIGVSGFAYVFDALSPGKIIALPIATALFGAVTGKVTGLINARRRLMRVIYTVQAHWKPETKSEHPMVCG